MDKKNRNQFQEKGRKTEKGAKEEYVSEKF